MVRLLAPLFVFCCLLASCAKQNAPSNEDVSDPPRTLPDDVKTIRELTQTGTGGLCGNGMLAQQQWQQMIRQSKLDELGEKRAFAACETILANPKNPEEITQLYSLIGESKGDRSRFVDLAVQSLKHPNEGVRTSAAWLLGKIGTPKQAAALTAALSDSDAGVIVTAAEALSILGGPAELISLDRWLAGPGRQEEYEFVRADVETSRNVLRVRIEK